MGCFSNLGLGLTPSLELPLMIAVLKEFFWEAEEDG